MQNKNCKNFWNFIFHAADLRVAEESSQTALKKACDNMEGTLKRLVTKEGKKDIFKPNLNCQSPLQPDTEPTDKNISVFSKECEEEEVFWCSTFTQD